MFVCLTSFNIAIDIVKCDRPSEYGEEREREAF